MKNKIMGRKWPIVLVAVVLLIGTATAVEFYFNRTIVYECKNTLTKLPVFIKVQTFGAIKLLKDGTSWVEANYHDTDGEVRGIVGIDKNYFDDVIFTVWERIPSFDKKGRKNPEYRSYIYLDLNTGSYTLSYEEGRERAVIASGLCRLKN